MSLAICSALGVWLILGSTEAALAILGNTAFEAVRKDVFAVIPLFVLMGDIISRSGAAAICIGYATAAETAARPLGHRYNQRKYGVCRSHRRFYCLRRGVFPDRLPRDDERSDTTRRLPWALSLVRPVWEC